MYAGGVEQVISGARWARGVAVALLTAPGVVVAHAADHRRSSRPGAGRRRLRRRRPGRLPAAHPRRRLDRRRRARSPSSPATLCSRSRRPRERAAAAAASRSSAPAPRRGVRFALATPRAAARRAPFPPTATLTAAAAAVAAALLVLLGHALLAALTGRDRRRRRHRPDRRRAARGRRPAAPAPARRAAAHRRRPAPAHPGTRAPWPRSGSPGARLERGPPAALPRRLTFPGRRRVPSPRPPDRQESLVNVPSSPAAARNGPRHPARRGPRPQPSPPGSRSPRGSCSPWCSRPPAGPSSPTRRARVRSVRAFRLLPESVAPRLRLRAARRSSSPSPRCCSWAS